MRKREWRRGSLGATRKITLVEKGEKMNSYKTTPPREHKLVKRHKFLCAPCIFHVKVGRE